ncbi:hypothetical protein CSA08_03710 [Candidatus Gracilibacteria bacterium]|nr:MAG: hypothetical protein CSA08_03710 [Candidatus Gracilibacteria bacterium]
MIGFFSGTYLGDNVKIFFDDSFTDLSGALYKGSSVVLNVLNQTATFSDSDNTKIDITSSAYNFPDTFDDNMNGDDYLPGSGPGNVAYPNNYQDDDALARLEINGYVDNLDFKNIFWSNSDISEYIDNNANNHEGFNSRISNVSDAYIYLTVNTGAILKLLEINKNDYDSTKNIVLDNVLSGSILAGSGYIQNNAGVLSLSPVITGNEYNFDFTSTDYALFLKKLGTLTLNYNLKAEESSGKKVYIVPLNDSSPNEISFLGNNILEKDGLYIGRTQELKKYLKFGVGAGSNYVIAEHLGGKRRSDGSYARTCYEYRFPDPGSNYRYSGSIGDGYYWLNPGGMGAFKARCDMTGGGWTKALITPNTRFQIIGIDSFSKLNTFTYDLTQAQISAIKSLSTEFRQYFKKECYRSIVYDFDDPNQVKWRTYGSALFKGNNFPNYNICDDHNLDPVSSPKIRHESAGNVLTGSYLPIVELWGGDTGSESSPGVYTEDSYYTFGDFYMR